MQYFKDYIRKFWNDESGMELLQFAVIVGITALLIPVIIGIKNAVEETIRSSETTVRNEFRPIGDVSGGGST